MANLPKPLTARTYNQLVTKYHSEVEKDFKPKRDLAVNSYRLLLGLTPRTDREADIIREKMDALKPLIGATISHPLLSFPLVSSIARDFGRTKGLRVFGFGVGYAPELYFLKNHMGASVGGVDLGYHAHELTSKYHLNIIHGRDGADPTLAVQAGPHDVTYSMNLLDPAIISVRTSLGILDNIAKMTRKGGRSYHYVSVGPMVVDRRDFEQRGFKIDEWLKEKSSILVKLTKVRD